MLRIAILMTAVLASVASAAEHHGRIDRETTWSGEIDVPEDCVVGAGVTLHIDHATVRFGKGAQLKVEGTLAAIDSTFTSASAKPAPSDWKGIHIEPQALAFAPPAQTGSSLRGCTIRFAHTAVRIVGRGLSGPPQIAECTIEKCRWGGIVVEGASGAIVEKNALSEICLDGPSDQGRPIALFECTAAKVAENLVQSSSDCGIFLSHSSGTEVRGNKTQHIVGGPGPGPGGAYARWGFGIMLLDSDDNRIIDNDVSDSAYISICLAYGSDRNRIEGNQCGTALDAINLVGEGKDNVCRNNRVAGGWTMLYLTGSGPIRFEKCSANSAGGYCFTVRTGEAEFVDCTWSGTCGMNIWGGKVRVDHCRLRDAQQHSVSLQNDGRGTLIDCDFDANAMRVTPDATGRIEVQNRLTLKVIDKLTGKPLEHCHATARATVEKIENVTAETNREGSAILPLTQFTFSAAGKAQIAPWRVKVEADGYVPTELVFEAKEPSARTLELQPARGNK